MFNLRGMAPRDYETCAEIDWRDFPQDAWNAERFRKYSESHRLIFNVCVDVHDQIVGYFAYRPSNKGLALKRAVIREHYRRLGVGASFLYWMMSAAKRLGVPKVTAAVPDSLLPVPHLWLLGCNFKQRERTFVGDERASVFELQVPQPALVRR